MSEIAVSAHQLTKRFGRFTAVDCVSFEVYKSEIFGFLGANGAGKTTTIRMLCGLLIPTSGTGRVAGYDISRESERIKQHIGYMSQKFSLYADLTVEENIEFYGGIYGLPTRRLKQRKSEIVETLDLHHIRHIRTANIPVGWKQRLALGCAILHQPKILFLDEPTGGVDPVSRREFWNLIYNLTETGTTLFVTTHYMDEAEYCNRLSIMHQGRIIALGSPMDLKQQYQKSSVEEVFVSLVSQN